MCKCDELRLEVKRLEAENARIKLASRKFIEDIRQLSEGALSDIEVIEDYPAKCGTLSGTIKAMDYFIKPFEVKIQ